MLADWQIGQRATWAPDDQNAALLDRAAVALRTGGEVDHDLPAQPAQAQLLESTLDELPMAGEQMERMVADWSHGDPDALALAGGWAAHPVAGRVGRADNLRHSTGRGL